MQNLGIPFVTIASSELASRIGDGEILDHRWWKHSSICGRCPISGFPIHLLPHPPFKLRAESGQPQKVILVDGKYLALKLVVDGVMNVCGRNLDDSDLAALDTYIQRCNLGGFRLKRFVRLAENIADPSIGEAQRSEFSGELQEQCSAARNELAGLQRIHQIRLLQSNRTMPRRVFGNQANVGGFPEWQANLGGIAGVSSTLSNPQPLIQDAQAMGAEIARQEESTHVSDGSGDVGAQPQNGVQHGGPSLIGISGIAPTGVVDDLGRGEVTRRDGLLQLMRRAREGQEDYNKGNAGGCDKGASRLDPSGSAFFARQISLDSLPELDCWEENSLNTFLLSDNKVCRDSFEDCMLSSPDSESTMNSSNFTSSSSCIWSRQVSEPVTLPSYRRNPISEPSTPPLITGEHAFTGMPNNVWQRQVSAGPTQFPSQLPRTFQF